MMDTQIYLPRKLRQSRLQKKILVHLSKKPETSVSAISEAVRSSRPSVSRCLHKLKKAGLVWKSLDGYELTIFGKEESLGVEIADPVIDIKIRWWEASMGFDCPCGNIDIVISDESGDKICECGRVYRFSSKIELVTVVK